jgi:hypothetical protein
MTPNLTFVKYIFDGILAVGVVAAFLVSWLARVNASRE